MSDNPSASGNLTVARRPRRAKRLVLAGGVVTVAAITAVVGLGAGADQPPPASNAAKSGGGAGGSGGVSGGAPRGTLDQYEVSKGDFEITTTATGDLRARNQVEIRSEVEQETTIVEIVPEGTNVKKGDVLIRLNAESTQTRLDEESLALESARASVVEANETYAIQISENESAKRAADLKLALAKLSLDQWRLGEVKSKEQELQHAFDTSQKDVERLTDKVAKSRDLKKAGYYSADSLQQDELELDRAVAAYDKAKLSKQIYWDYEHPKEEKQKTSDVEEAAAEVERVVRQNASKLVSKEADKKNKERSLAIRQAKYDKLRAQLEAATIKAPSDGLVVYATSIDTGRWGGDESGPLQVGSKVYPQKELIVLPDTSEMMAYVKVHESLAGRVRKGMPCSIKIDAAGDTRFTGRVDSIGVLAEQTSRWMDPTLREYTVKIAIDKPTSEGSQLRPSMRCEAEVTLGRVADAITVPIQAVYSEGLLRYVHVLADDGRYGRRPVMVGQRSDRFAEVKLGLDAGERVLMRKPDASELTGKSNGWDPAQLAAVGLEINTSGDIVPSAAAMAARMNAGGGPKPGGRGPAMGGKPPRAPGDAAAPAAPIKSEEGATKSEEKKDDTSDAAKVEAPTPAK